MSQAGYLGLSMRTASKRVIKGGARPTTGIGSLYRRDRRLGSRVPMTRCPTACKSLLGAILTPRIILGLLLAETLVVLYRQESAWFRQRALSSRPESRKLLPFLVRAVRATIWVGAAAVLVRTWAVDVLNLVDEQAWGEFSRAWSTTVVTALLAYFAWEAVHFGTAAACARPRPGAANEEADADTARGTAQRYAP